jgi:hypothetical protein
MASHPVQVKRSKLKKKVRLERRKCALTRLIFGFGLAEGWASGNLKGQMR